MNMTKGITKLGLVAMLVALIGVGRYASAQEDAPGKAPSARTVSASAAPDAPPVAAVNHSVKRDLPFLGNG
jgi:hypothetical protein